MHLFPSPHPPWAVVGSEGFVDLVSEVLPGIAARLKSPQSTFFRSKIVVEDIGTFGDDIDIAVPGDIGVVPVRALQIHEGRSHGWWPLVPAERVSDRLVRCLRANLRPQLGPCPQLVLRNCHIASYRLSSDRSQGPLHPIAPSMHKGAYALDRFCIMSASPSLRPSNARSFRNCRR